MPTEPPKVFVRTLALLLALFCFRVIAQFVQWVSPVAFLPPFSQWASGALPYPVLLACQAIIIALCVRVILNFSQNAVLPRARKGKWLLAAGGIYFAFMSVRLAVGLTLARDHYWWGATLPALFHLVLAAFLLLVGGFHVRYGKSHA